MVVHPFSAPFEEVASYLIPPENHLLAVLVFLSFDKNLGADVARMDAFVSRVKLTELGHDIEPVEQSEARDVEVNVEFVIPQPPEE